MRLITRDKDIIIVKALSITDKPVYCDADIVKLYSRTCLTCIIGVILQHFSQWGYISRLKQLINIGFAGSNPSWHMIITGVLTGVTYTGQPIV